MKPTTGKPSTLNEKVEHLFTEPAIPIDLATQYVNSLVDNLTTTEKAIHKDFYRIILLFLGFIILDSGLVENVSIVGTQLKKSGYIAILFPLAISFFYYQLYCRMTFADEIRTCLAVFFRKFHRNLYLGCFDLLLHYPSVRNIETYQSKDASGRAENFIFHLSTWTVTLVFGFGPIIVVAYAVYRAQKYTDLPIVWWIVTTLASAIFIVRGLVLAVIDKGDRSFGKRIATQV